MRPATKSRRGERRIVPRVPAELSRRLSLGLRDRDDALWARPAAEFTEEQLPPTDPAALRGT